MKLNILFVDDDPKLRKNLVKTFNEEEIEGYTLIASEAQDFEEGKKILKENDFDIVVLDLYKGAPQEGNEKSGLEVLNEIQSETFIPVIFYSGLTKDIHGMESEVVGIVTKGGDGIEQLKSEISRIIRSNIALIKRKVYNHVKLTLRDYFWKTVHENKAILEPVKNDISIGYLLLRRLAHSLSKENIKILLGDENIKKDKAHPMEFYLYPSNNGEYEAGEILHKDSKFYVVLTPSCDFITAGSRPRKVEQVLLAIAIPLKETEAFQKYSNDREKYRQTLASLIESRKGDRYFFLPGTPFIDNLVLDFQVKTMVSYGDLVNFQRVAKLDTPFAQSMISSFVRYYNRIGFPDIDADYVINNLKP